MSNKDLTQDNAENNTEEAPVETEASVAEAPAEESIGDLLGEDTSSDEPKEESKDDKPTVGLDKFLKEKKKRQDAEQQLKELADNDDDEDEDDPDESKPEEDKSNAEQRLAKLEAREQQKERDEKYDKVWEKTLEANPEFKDLADKETIKQLVFNPKNKNKTMSQVLESVYGNAIQGRPSIETDIQQNSPEPGKVDVDRAKKDPAYFKEVMKDPTLKAEYNKGLTERLSASL